MSLKFLKLVIPCTVFAFTMLLTAVQSQATPAYAKKEGVKCTVCHVTMGKKDLNDTGKCYKEHDHSLAACNTK
jgi:hypothetical protein